LTIVRRHNYVGTEQGITREIEGIQAERPG
jgi:hypothetical protein